MLNSIRRAGFRFRVGTSNPSKGNLVEPKYFQVLGLIWTTILRQNRAVIGMGHMFAGSTIDEGAHGHSAHKQGKHGPAGRKSVR